MATQTPNLHLYKPDATDPFGDFLNEFNNNMDTLDGASGGGHTIIDPNGTEMPAEGKLQFTGNVTVTDDNVNGKTVVNITGGGGGGGGVSNFTETVLATASSFSDMTVDFSTAYDAFIFYVNDVTTQKSENYFFTRSEITDAINNNLTIYMYPYGSSGYCQYKITRSGLTRLGNSSGFFIYKIVGLNFGSTPHIYSTSEQVIGAWIDSKPLYEITLEYHGNINANTVTNLVNIASLNIDSLIVLSGSIYESGWGWEQVPTNNFRLHYNTTSGYVEAVTGAFAISGDCYVNVQYTKTTD